MLIFRRLKRYVSNCLPRSSVTDQGSFISRTSTFGGIRCLTCFDLRLLIFLTISTHTIQSCFLPPVRCLSRVCHLISGNCLNIVCLVTFPFGTPIRFVIIHFTVSMFAVPCVNDRPTSIQDERAEFFGGILVRALKTPHDYLRRQKIESEQAQVQLKKAPPLPPRQLTDAEKQKLKRHDIHVLREFRRELRCIVEDLLKSKRYKYFAHPVASESTSLYTNRIAIF